MMKRNMSMLVGILIGICIASTVPGAYAGLMAERSQTPFLVNGHPAEVEAYMINGNNYMKLRDIAALIDFGVTWDAKAKTVLIDTTVGYTPESAAQDAEEEVSSPAYHTLASPEVFNGQYTREAYDLIREAIVTGKSEVFDVTESLDKAIADACAAASLYPWLKVAYSPGQRGQIVSRVSDPCARAAAEVSELTESVKGMSDMDKLRTLSDYVCSKLDYNASKLTAPVRYFTTPGVSEGNCMSFAHGLKFLCDLADLPCILVHSEIHQWNMVYVDGNWYEVDLTSHEISYNAGRRDNLIGKDFAKDSPRIYTIIDPELTRFAQELLVPGSTQ